MTNCIEIQGLCKQYDQFQLEDITFTVPGGSIVGLIGENGAGKTTTLKSILGLVHPDGGAIALFDGAPDAAARQEIGLVLDDCFFHDTLRPKDVDAILAPIYQNWDSALFAAYLQKFSLPERKYIKEFSRGMKVKLSLAAALSHSPKLLILDEATSGLDPVVRDEILDEFLAFVSDDDHAILISSHIISDLEKVADYIAYIHQGTLILFERKDAILEYYGRLACTRQQLAEVVPEDLLRVKKSNFTCEGLVENRSAFQRKYPSLLVEPISLEEIMVFFGKGEPA